MKANVYFTREITPENVVRLYQALGITLPGKVAVKVHSGEKGNQNYLHPEFWKPMVDAACATIPTATGNCWKSTAGPSILPLT